MFEILVTSSFLILALALLRKWWKRRLSPILQYALWLLVAVRLLVPVPVFGNALSIMNIIDAAVRDAGGQIPDHEKESSALDFIYTPERVVLSGKAGTPQEARQRDIDVEAASSNLPEMTAKGEGNLSGTPEEIPEAWKEEIETEEMAAGTFSGAGFFGMNLARNIWYGGIGTMAAGMLLFNGLFYRRLCRERRFLGRKGKIRIYEAKNLDSPCLYGLLHPAVYLTPDSLLSQRCREHAIAHELTHYRHGDHFWILVRSLCAVIYWFDPFVWLALYLSARDCELACDAGTIRNLGEEQREAYGYTLIEMASPAVSRMNFLRCVMDLAGGKKELKERITVIADGKKKMGLVAAFSLFCAVLLAACTFGGAKEETVQGGYVESVIELPALPVPGVYADLVQGEEGMRLVDAYGEDSLSVDGGETFGPAENIPAAVRSFTDGIYKIKGGPGGSRMFLRNHGVKEWMLVTSGGSLERLEIPGEEESFYPEFYYGAGYFYTKNGFAIYRTDAASSDTRLVWESENQYAVSLAADENLLYIVTLDGLVLYDLERQEIAGQQDEALGAFLEGQEDFLLYPAEKGVYVAAHEGIFWHELYGDRVECLMEGEMYGLGNRDRELVGMAVTETDGREAFLVYCSDGTLLRYEYDETYVPVQNVLRVYSVYEDSNIRRAVTKFREKYPNIPIKYEVGIRMGYGKNLDDALKNLSTELAAGNGPDVLVMDDIPYSSYLKKGVLEELSSVREQMAEEDYFVSIIDAVGREQSGLKDGIYMIPLSFVVPVLAGEEGAIQGVQSLTELGDLAEEAGTEGKSVLGFVNAKEALSLLAQSSMGAWVSVEGSLDREALTEFMTQAKRIYEIQMQAVPEELKGRIVGSPQEETILQRRFGEYGMGEAGNAFYNKFSFFPEQPYCAGYLGEEYALLNGYLKIDGATWQRMPGQKYGACIPLSLAAVNSGSKAKEESLLFLEYALSEEFQGAAALKGLPVNRNAYLKAQENPDGEDAGNQVYANVRISVGGGAEKSREIYWPDEADFRKLDRMVEEITEVNLCEDKIYEEVIRQGEKLLAGALSVEEAVDAVESALRIYLAE